MSKCKIKVYYEFTNNKKELEKSVALNSQISKLNGYSEIKKAILDKSKDKKLIAEVKKIALKEGEKFILEIEEPKISGLDSVFNDKTYGFLINKINDGQIASLKLIIRRVREYPIWNPPQIYEKLKNALKKSAKENTDKLKEELIQIDIKHEPFEQIEDDELGNGYRVYLNNKKEEQGYSEEIYKDFHVHMFCNKCYKGNFLGFRYMCAECNNFNLCENCYQNEINDHDKEHVFIRIKDKVELDINLFSCLFETKSKIINRNNNAPFDLELDIFNNGEMDLHGCFLSPIRFGKKYLGCSKDSIKENILNGQKVHISPIFMFPDGGDELLEQYEGYFRLINSEGIPFGEIFYLQVNIVY